MKDEDYPAVEPDKESGTPPAPHRPEFGNKKPSHAKRWWIIGAVLLGVILLGGGAYWFWLSGADKPAPSTPSTVEVENEEELIGSEPDPNATSKTFKSETLNLEFSYSSDWTLKETDDKAEVIVTSPRATYTDLDGTSKQGVFTVKLRNGLIPEAQQETVKSLIAVKNSEVIAYDAPTEMQRHYTNLSFGGPTATEFSMFIVTGSVTFGAGVPFGSQVNLIGQSYLFVGGYGTDAEDTLSFEPVPAASFETEVYQQGVAIIKSLKIF